MPKRIQRKRTRGWRMPENTVYVGRPSKWGNPFNYRVNFPHNGTPELDVALYRNMLERGQPELKRAAKKELIGKDLACWCPLDKPCHADVLLELANGKI